jgi:hypothetical protein
MDTTMGNPELREILTTEAEIEVILGKPAPRIIAKTINALDDICRDCRNFGGHAAIAVDGYGSLAGVNFCPKLEPSVPL